MNVNYILIGDSLGKRSKIFADCLKNTGIYNYKMISWLDILNDISSLYNLIKENTVIKIDPPEKDLEIYRQLLIKGDSTGLISSKDIRSIDFNDKKIVHPKQWYNGFCLALDSINAAIKYKGLSNTVCMIDTEEAKIMMDKTKCYNRLSTHDGSYNLPKSLEHGSSFKEFYEIHGDKHIRCFIKLRYGSGGTGVLAYTHNPRLGKFKLSTSLAYSEHNRVFFNNNRVVNYRDRSDIDRLVTWVLEKGAHVESWIPKPSHDGMAYDTRVCIIDKKPEYLVSRFSKTPITNLHLRNKRLSTESFMNEGNIDSIKNASVDVMRCFNNSLYAGLDVVHTKDMGSYIIDVNPFGDLFYNLIDSPDNVYYKQIQKSIKMLGD